MIGKTIKNIVSQTGVKVCPVLVKIENPNKPLVVYNLDSLQPDYHKDLSGVPSQISYTVSIYSKDYDEIESLSLSIFNLLRTYSDSSVNQIRVTSMQDAGYNIDTECFQRDISVTAIMNVE